MLGFVVLSHFRGWRKAMSWGIWVYRGPSLVDLRPQRPRETPRKKRKRRFWGRQRLGEADRQTNKHADLCWLDSFGKQWRVGLGGPGWGSGQQISGRNGLCWELWGHTVELGGSAREEGEGSL